MMRAISYVKPVTNSLCVAKTEVTEKAKASSLLLLLMNKSLALHILTAVSIVLNIVLFKNRSLFKGIICKIR